ncbi:hypothetical protein [Methanomethylovorans sp.]|uniref:hypothetical protein n=1 Tax=Methanomethylovorans sp. TaxID=2758717 RepID=UPI00345E58DA
MIWARCKEKADEEKKKNCTHNYLRRFIRNDKYFDYYELECLYCGDKKGIVEPIEKIKKEEPKSTQKNTTQAKSKSQKKGNSKIIDSIKGIFR